MPVQSGEDVSTHFPDVRKMAPMGSGTKKPLAQHHKRIYKNGKRMEPWRKSQQFKKRT